MVKVKLSQRLARIANQVPIGSKLADIGSDHAMLPSYLVQQGIVQFAIAGEVSKGPLESAINQVVQTGLIGKIDVRLGDGLEVIAAHEVDVITIAGMGGQLIVRILSRETNKLAGVHTLILQPNVGAEQVRRWLFKHDWYLIGEDIVAEDGKIYEILIAVQVHDAFEKNRLLYAETKLNCGIVISPERLFKMGPYLLNDPMGELFVKWDEELQKLSSIKAQLSRSSSITAASKTVLVTQEIEEIREVLDCLLKDNM